MDYPHISILIAVRNEAANILGCLQSLEELEYPKEFIEVLIGDDQSTDNTASLVKIFIEDKPHFKMLTATRNIENLTGKANVLCQLGDIATGEFFFFTDADVKVPKRWIEGLLPPLMAGCGEVAGVTVVKGSSGFHHLQAIDWVITVFNVFNLSKRGLPLSGLGTNMAVSRKAYEQVGGYRSIDFPVTIDYGLFKAIHAAGFRFENIFNVEVLAFTEPMKTLLELLNQKTRWLYGAINTLPGGLKIVAILLSLTGPFIVLLLFLFPYETLIVLSLKLLISMIVLKPMFKRLELDYLWKFYPIYEIYSYIINFVVLVKAVFDPNLAWKSRIYRK